jgi:hypothetical protein
MTATAMREGLEAACAASLPAFDRRVVANAGPDDDDDDDDQAPPIGDPPDDDWDEDDWDDEDDDEDPIQLQHLAGA